MTTTSIPDPRFMWTEEDNAIAESEMVISRLVKISMSHGGSTKGMMDHPSVILIVTSLGLRFGGDFTLEVDPDGTVRITKQKARK